MCLGSRVCPYEKETCVQNNATLVSLTWCEDFLKPAEVVELAML